MKKIIILMVAIMAISTASSQDRAQNREIKRAEQQSLIATALASGRYVFKAIRANTSLRSKPTVELSTSSYDFRVTADSIRSYLPYYGKAYSAPMGRSESPLDFLSTDFTIKSSVKQGKKASSTIIRIQMKSQERKISYSATINVASNGSATLTIESNEITPITFYGEVVAIE